MIKRRGITLTVMVVTVIIFGILAGTIAISTYSTINYSRLSTWVSEITYIQDVVDEQLTRSSELDFIIGEIKINVSGLTGDEKNEQFSGETISADGMVQLFILDMNKLKILNTRYGNLQVETDVYALSKQTGKVYYVRGLESENKIYYSLTTGLKNRFELETATNNLTSVVFVPSVVGYSNEPVTVTVKVPNTYTEIVVTTSNEQITISSAELKEKVYEYFVNSNLVEGNYIISVSYNDGIQTLTSKYIVGGYDVTAPVIHKPMDEDFVYKENGDYDLYYLINVNATDASGIKTLKYALGEIDETIAKEYFNENGNYVVDGKINLDTSITHYTLYAEDNAGNISVLGFENLVPGKWRATVSAIVDTVPIPKRFVVSPYKGENTKKEGLVIYELKEDENEIPSTETQYTSWTTRNQYVWIPVERDKFETTFVRNDYINATSLANDINGRYYALGTSDKYWEVMVDESTNLPLTTITEQNATYMSATTLLEVQAMYASVKKYGGFFVARYEAGRDTPSNYIESPEIKEKVHSKMNKYTYTRVRWSESEVMNIDTAGVVEGVRNLYPNNEENITGVVSTLMYGVQWDRILSWWIEEHAKDINGNEISLADSTNYGNCLNHIINSANDLNEGAKVATIKSNQNPDAYVDKNDTILTYPKELGTPWLLTTGALKVGKIMNIYDMAGNVHEWSMEGYSTGERIRRGNSYNYDGNTNPVTLRKTYSPINAHIRIGFRVALYIK